MKVNIKNEGECEYEGAVSETFWSFEKMYREGTSLPLRNITLIEQPLLKFKILNIHQNSKFQLPPKHRELHTMNSAITFQVIWVKNIFGTTMDGWQYPSNSNISKAVRVTLNFTEPFSKNSQHAF